MSNHYRLQAIEAQHCAEYFVWSALRGHTTPTGRSPRTGHDLSIELGYDDGHLARMILKTKARYFLARARKARTDQYFRRLP